MTKEELLALVEAKIAGQGNQIDVGGALASILSELANHSSAIEVTNITTLTKAQLDSLSVGDKVVKVTGKQKHLYTVSYKGEGAGEGLCLTYADASGVETVSYDRTESGWAYNSTDKGSF